MSIMLRAVIACKEEVKSHSRARENSGEGRRHT